MKMNVIIGLLAIIVLILAGPIGVVAGICIAVGIKHAAMTSWHQPQNYWDWRNWLVAKLAPTKQDPPPPPPVE